MDKKELNLNDYQKDVVLVRKNTGVDSDLARIGSLVAEIAKLVKEGKQEETKPVLSELFACVAYTCYDINNDWTLQDIISIYGDKAKSIINR